MPPPWCKDFEQKVLRKEIDGLLLIPANVKETRQVSYYSTSVSDFSTIKFIESTLRTAISKQLLLEKRIDPAVVDEATREISMETFKVKKEGTTKSDSGMDYMMSLFMIVILFMILINYGQMIMRGILEEKTSRISELLIASARSTHIFYGKLLGIGLAGLTQVALWIVLGAVLVSRFSGMVDAAILSFLTPEIALYFVIFFILGFFTYAIPYAFIGAAVNTDQEAQQFASVLSVLIIVPYILGISAIQNPNSTLTTVASLFPLFTPILMFMRITDRPAARMADLHLDRPLRPDHLGPGLAGRQDLPRRHADVRQEAVAGGDAALDQVQVAGMTSDE